MIFEHKSFIYTALVTYFLLNEWKIGIKLSKSKYVQNKIYQNKDKFNNWTRHITCSYSLFFTFYVPKGFHLDVNKN